MNTQTNRINTRLLALLTTLCLLLGIAPIMVLAEDYGMQGAGVKIQMLQPSDITVDSASETEYVNTIKSPVSIANGVATFQLKVNNVGNNIPKDTQANVNNYFNQRCALFYVKDVKGETVTGTTFTCHDSDPIGGSTNISWYMDVSGLAEGASYTLVIPGNSNQSLIFGGKWNNWGIKSDIYFNFTTAAPAPAPTPMRLSEDSISVNKGARSSWVNIICEDSDKPLTVVAQDPNLLTVQFVSNETVSHFRVTAKDYGSTDVVVTSADGKKQAVCKVTVPAPPVSGVGLSDTVLLLEPNASKTLTATVFPEASENKKVTWSSSDEAVAIVDTNGTVTALSNGTAIITATTEDGGKTASCIVNPKEENIPYGIQGNGDALALYVRQLDEGTPVDIQTTRKANGDYWNVIPKAHSYYRKDFMLTVDIGNAEGLGSYDTTNLYGKAVLYEDKDLTKVVSTFEKGNGDFTITKYGDQWTWERSSDGAMLVVQIKNLTPDKDYYLVFQKDIEGAGVTLGSNVIFEFHSKPVAVDAVSLDKTELTLDEGVSATLSATVSPEDASNKNVTWTSSDEKVATVDETGNVTAVKAGSATITVTTEDGEKTATCTVIVSHKHVEEVLPGKEATCTETGLTEGKKCSVCNEVLVVREDIPALGHDYKDGKCTRCGAEDPDYKPEEPDEPTPVEPDTKFTGLADAPDANGDWWYYTDGEIDKNHTGVDQNKYGWWRVENGKVNFNAQSIYSNKFGWWKTTDGKVTFDETGVFNNQFGWWRVEGSKVNFDAQSIYSNRYGWWKTTDGKVTFKENGLFKNQYGTWKVENSKVNFNYNGKYQGKTIKNGKVV